MSYQPTIHGFQIILDFRNATEVWRSGLEFQEAFDLCRQNKWHIGGGIMTIQLDGSETDPRPLWRKPGTASFRCNNRV